MSAAQEGQGVRLVVVGGQHHHPGPGVLLPDLVGRVDPLQLEQRRHLDVRHDDVGDVFVRRLEQGRSVAGHSDHLDAVRCLEKRANALADEDVVLPEHDPDRQARQR